MKQFLGQTIEYDGPAYMMESGTEFRYTGRLVIEEFDSSERGHWVNAYADVSGEPEDSERGWLILDELPEVVWFVGKVLPDVSGLTERLLEELWGFEEWFDHILEDHLGIRQPWH